MKNLSELLAEVEPIKYPLYDVENYTAVDRASYDKLKAIAVELSMAIEAARDKNSEALNGIARGFVAEADSDIRLANVSLDFAITTARKMLEGK